MSRASEALAEFHDAFGVKVGTHAEVAERRRTLHEEEHRELREALAALAEVEGLRDEIIDGGGHARPLDAHRAAVARELADVMVVAYGTADLLDIDLDVAFEAVHAANMAKLPPCEVCVGGDETGTPEAACICGGTGKGKPVKRLDGKVMKPEGWQPPSMAKAIS